ncbi:MAG: AMP-binding protein, partial [Myxococcales bacterium]|nr:AMP-binding protein [Myxococcales bacterium]
MTPGWRSLPALLVDAAATRGDAPAIVSPTETTSYAELFGAALELANELEPARGQLVALALPKSKELVTAWLACWFAGAAFSTLDPSLP